LAEFTVPNGIAVDQAGNVYVSNFTSVRKITPSGAVTTLAGTGTPGYADGLGSAAKFRGLWGIAVDSAGNVFVADLGNGHIRKISETGQVSTLAGGGEALGIAVDGAGNIYLGGGAGLHRLSAGISTQISEYISINSPYEYIGVAVGPLGMLYIAGGSKNRVLVVSP